MHLVYQVEVWISERDGWHPVGPVFTVREAAERYMGTVAPKLSLRLIDLPLIDTSLGLQGAGVSEPPSARLQFARHLVESRRINEDLE